MADAAEKQAIWTRRQFWATIGEIIALVLTIAIAIVATGIAFHANAIARDGNEKMLRAYVCVTAADVKWENDRVARAVILMKNTGQSPAKHVTSWTSIAIGHKTDFPAPDDLGGGSKGIIGANSPYTLQCRTAPLDDQTWGQIRNRKVPLWVWGEISYVDIFERERRRTSFRFLLHDKEDLFHPVSDGNDAT